MSIKQMETSELGKFVSISLNYNLENKTGAALAGQIFTNLGEMASTKLHRLESVILNAFCGAEWVDSKAVCTHLLKKIADLTSQVQKIKAEDKKEPSTSTALITIQNEITQMREVCDLLKKNKLMNENVKNLQTKLANLNTIISQRPEPKENIEILTEQVLTNVTEEHQKTPVEVTVKPEGKRVKEKAAKQESREAPISRKGIEESEKGEPKIQGAKEQGDRPTTTLEELRSIKQKAKSNPIPGLEAGPDAINEPETEFREESSQEAFLSFKQVFQERQEGLKKTPGRVRIPANLFKKEDIGLELKAIIKNAYAYKEGTLLNSLGRHRGSKSAENKILNDIEEKDFSEMPFEEIKSNVLEAFNLIKKGFKQAEVTVPEDLNLRMGNLTKGMTKVGKTLRLEEDNLKSEIKDLILLIHGHAKDLIELSKEDYFFEETEEPYETEKPYRLTEHLPNAEKFIRDFQKLDFNNPQAIDDARNAISIIRDVFKKSDVEISEINDQLTTFEHLCTQLEAKNNRLDEIKEERKQSK